MSADNWAECPNHVHNVQSKQKNNKGLFYAKFSCPCCFNIVRKRECEQKQ